MPYTPEERESQRKTRFFPKLLSFYTVHSYSPYPMLYQNFIHKKKSTHGKKAQVKQEQQQHCFLDALKHTHTQANILRKECSSKQCNVKKMCVCLHVDVYVVLLLEKSRFLHDQSLARPLGCPLYFSPTFSKTYNNSSQLYLEFLL